MMSTRSVYYCSYSIGKNAYELVADICRPHGKRALLIGGEKAMAAALPRLQAQLEGNGIKIVESVVYGKDCTFSAIRSWADYAKMIRVDMIFAMGGGRAMDTAKAAAEAANLPVFTFPTSASTCSATSSLSVVYREDGSFEDFYYFRRPPCHCFIDLTVIAQAPWQFLQAGMGDTIGKHFECHFSSRGDKLEHSSALGREISNMCYAPLLEHGEQALLDCKAHRVSSALEQATLASIVSTGLVSLLVHNDYNSAVAHSVYYALVLLPGFEERWLHGNVVAYGVLVQLAVDQDLEEARRLKAFLQKLEIPTTLAEMDIPLDRVYLQQVLSATVAGPDMVHIPYPVSEDMLFEAMSVIEHL